MGDLELSLDDIIKKKLGKSNVNRNRNNGVINKKPIRRQADQGNRAAKTSNAANNKTFVRGGISKTARGAGPAVGVGDARLKIIQKQRQKITDARDKLGQIAKQTDARLRLMKLRERRGLAQAAGLGMRGTLAEEHMLQRTIRPPVAFEDELMDFTNDIAYMSRTYADRAISDEEAYNYQFRGRQVLPNLYRTVENDAPPSRLYSQDQSVYSWKNPRGSPMVDDLQDIPVKRIGGRVLQTSNFRSDERRGDSPAWDYDEPPIVITKKIKPMETVGILKRSTIGGGYHDREAVRIIKESPPPSVKSKGPAKTLSERFCQDGNPQSSQMINLLKSRQESGESGGKSSDRSDSSETVGHRIVVSNLVPSVTHEDVKELFEDIGELLSSKVVRPGTAEVVYKLHKDAVKAVDVYHNRQLDGQPMKCLLVNNRTSLSIASKTSKLSERKAGKGIVELDMTAFRKALHKKSTS